MCVLLTRQAGQRPERRPMLGALLISQLQRHSFELTHCLRDLALGFEVDHSRLDPLQPFNPPRPDPREVLLLTLVRVPGITRNPSEKSPLVRKTVPEKMKKPSQATADCLCTYARVASASEAGCRGPGDPEVGGGGTGETAGGAEGGGLPVL